MLANAPPPRPVSEAMNLAIIGLNVLYAGIGVAGAVAGMYAAYKTLDHLTPFDCSRELVDNNVAVGIAVGGMFIGIGIAVGLTIGMGLN